VVLATTAPRCRYIGHGLISERVCDCDVERARCCPFVGLCLDATLCRNA
jgi:hypothetical protein